jgi:predicted TPR repeat methyltransferase
MLAKAGRRWEPRLQASDDNILDQALALLKAGYFLDAERHFRDVLLRQPRHARAHSLLGTLLIQTARHEEAEQHLRWAIRLGQCSAVTYYNHGIALKRLKQPADALDAFNKALAINSADSDAWNNRGTTFKDLAQYEKAIADFDQAILLKPDFAGAFVNKANSLFLSGRHEEALAAYDRAVALRSDLVEGWLGRARALCRLGRDAEALAAFDAMLARKPDLAEALLGRADALYRLERYRDALAAYDRALTVNPEHAGGWLGRGSSCQQLNLHGEALEAYDKALALEPGLAAAHYRRGIIFHHCDRYEEALAAYDRALALQPELAEAWLGRGNVLGLMKQPEQAIEAYRQALAKGGEAEVLRYALASLGAEAVPGAAPRRFTAELFDWHADQYDQHMVGTLKYQAPDLLSDSLARVLPQRKLDILDLGCGTGLLGARLRPLAATLTGIDFSPKMLARARERGVYDNLVCDDLTEYLRRQSGNFDLAVATDVFTYIGDLAPVFSGAHTALAQGGFFGFSVEATEEGDFVLKATQRYAHSSAYLRALAREHRFIVETMDAGTIRQENGIDAAGYFAVLRRH